MRCIALGILLAATLAFAQTESPSSKEAYEQGKKSFDEGKYEEAISHLDQAIEQDPTSKNAYLLRGTSYDYIGQYDQAIQDYTRAIEIDPQFVGAYNNRGSVYITLEDYEHGLPDLNKALELNPENANSYYNRAIINTHLSQSAEVISDAHAYLDIAGCKDPRGQNVILMSMFAYRELGKFADAENFLKQTSSLCDPSIWPYPVIRFMKNEISPDALLAEAMSEQEKADAKTFIAYNQYQEPDGKSPEAIKELRWVVDLNYRDSISYILAKKLLRTFEPIVPPQQ